MPSIEVTISPTGDTTVEAKGCSGPSCQSLTEAIEKAIGTTHEDVKKPEFHRPQYQQAGQQQKAVQ